MTLTAYRCAVTAAVSAVLRADPAPAAVACAACCADPECCPGEPHDATAAEPVEVAARTAVYVYRCDAGHTLRTETEPDAPPEWIACGCGERAAVVECETLVFSTNAETAAWARARTEHMRKERE